MTWLQRIVALHLILLLMFQYVVLHKVASFRLVQFTPKRIIASSACGLKNVSSSHVITIRQFISSAPDNTRCKGFSCCCCMKSRSNMSFLSGTIARDMMPSSAVKTTCRNVHQERTTTNYAKTLFSSSRIKNPIFYSSFIASNTPSRQRMSYSMSLSTNNRSEKSQSSKLAVVYGTMAILYFVIATFMILLNNGIVHNQFTSYRSVSEMVLLPNQYSAINHSGAIGFFLASFLSLFLHRHHSGGSKLLVVEDDDRAPDNDSNMTDSGDCLEEKNSPIVRNWRSITGPLNFGLGMFSLIGLLSIPGESALLMPSFSCAIGLYSVMSLSRFIGTWCCWNEWFRDNNRTRGLWRSSSSGLVVAKAKDEINRGRRTPGLYTMIQLFALSRIVHNVMSVLHATKYSSTKNLWFMKSIYISAVARLCLVWSIASALKESAFRGDLEGTSRFQLQFLLGFWAVSGGLISGFIDANLLSFILQKSVYLMVFAWPIMFKGDKDRRSEEDKPI